jgi:flavin-binding protein dodecin
LGEGVGGSCGKNSITLKDLRISEVEELDIHLEAGKVIIYRTKVRISFKYHGKKEI